MYNIVNLCIIKEIIAMSILKDRIATLIDEAYQKAVKIREHLHMYPELSGEEKETAAYVASCLDSLGIEKRTDIAGHGLIGTIFGKDRSHAVGIRADMDALPVQERVPGPICSRNAGVMHACGHDMHTAILLGTAEVLNEISDELPYSVRLIFQPTEETTGGAKPMIDEGILKDMDVSDIIGLHVEPRLDTGEAELVPGIMNASIYDFHVKVHGKGCHGAHPDKGIDAIPCASSMVLAYQTLITRRLDPTTSALITVGTFHSGTQENVISGEAELSGTIRAFDSSVMELLLKEFKEMTESIASSFGCTADVDYVQGYPNLINDAGLLDKVRSACCDSLGEENVVINTTASLGGDDFAFFCHEARGCYFNLGCHDPKKPERHGLHSDLFDPDEKCIKTGITAEVYSVLKIMGIEF